MDKITEAKKSLVTTVRDCTILDKDDNIVHVIFDIKNVQHKVLVSMSDSGHISISVDGEPWGSTINSDDDIVARLRKRHETEGWIDDANVELDAADEIERLQTALQLAVGELSTYNEHRFVGPDMLYEYFLNKAQRT